MTPTDLKPDANYLLTFQSGGQLQCRVLTDKGYSLSVQRFTKEGLKCYIYHEVLNIKKESIREAEEV